MAQAKQKLVVLTGAGISAESGLKTFRDSDGLWEGYNVYDVATPRGFAANPKLVLDFYNERRKDVAAAEPNAAHKGLAALEAYFDVCIITQNIDDLHERGGSTNVVHLHGQIFEMKSVHDNETIYSITDNIEVGDVDEKGHQLRPNIVWFEEEVPMIAVAAQIVKAADIFVVVGTSLQVNPAAGLVSYASPRIPKYIIDKKIPALSNKTIITIEATATKGVEQLTKILIP